MIFNTIVNAFLEDFSEPVSSKVEDLVALTVSIYNTVMKEMKPTPAKSHYLFNLRDIAKIFAGLCSADKKTSNDLVTVTKLWVHENTRVFGDRMVSQEDRDKL